MAAGHVVYGALPALQDSGDDDGSEYALVLQTPQSDGGPGRGHLFLMRRRVGDIDPLRPWERVGGQIDDMDPRDDDYHPGDPGVQRARLSCRLATGSPACVVAYEHGGRLIVARLVQAGHGYSWHRTVLNASSVRGVGELAIYAYGDQARVAWIQADRASSTGWVAMLAGLGLRHGTGIDIHTAVSLGPVKPGHGLQLVRNALLVVDEHEIRVYNAGQPLFRGNTEPTLSLRRAQANGRVLLSRSPGSTSGVLVAEPAPGGTLVHQLTLAGGNVSEVGRYRLDHPDWLIGGGAPMALTANDDRGWLVVGAAGVTGPYALVEITPRVDELGARIYQLPDLPPPTGQDPGDGLRVIPAVIGVVNATTRGGAPTIDLLTSAILFRSAGSRDPFGAPVLLSERITPGSGSTG